MKWVRSWNKIDFVQQTDICDDYQTQQNRVRLLCMQSLGGKIFQRFSFSFQVEEKNVLPTAEDVKTEKTHQGIFKGVEGFEKTELKHQQTREPLSGTERELFL